MHDSSIAIMQDFVYKRLSVYDKYKILDVGSYNVNGTYASIFSNWKYHGLDIVKGPNVDIVVSPDDWGIENEYDVVVSGQALEHVYDMFKFVKNMYKAANRTGVVCIIAPWQCDEHRYPVDCWRILPDGMRYLLEKAGFKNIMVEKHKVVDGIGDCVGMGVK